MALEIQIPRNIDNILASADERGLSVIAGWTMVIPRAVAVEYIRKYNQSSAQGFFKNDDGKVVLSHGGGKLTLSETEASAVVELIKEAYGS